MEWLRRIKRTDGDAVAVKIAERELQGSGVGVHMWLFFQLADERARPWQSHVKIVDLEEQEEAVERLGVVGTCQRGCSWAPHSWRQSKTVPSESRICPK